MHAKPKFRVGLAAAATLLGATALTGCVSLPDMIALASGGGSKASQSPNPDATPAPTASSPIPEADDDAVSGGVGDDLGDAFAEREQFFRDQQLPLDGSLLTAVTPQQQEFISQQRSYVESQGGTWTPEAEHAALALAADACETSILNGHEVDTDTFISHFQTEPLLPALVPDTLPDDQRAVAERNVASIMVFGTGFLCPADAPQWEAGFAEVYGN
ncbi:hypothetical protein [Leucobacter japonicus]|uniref:hypothetical protein n=1 Tax=Leucobacter japonicus TaxID=1461259 RepID=UPI000AC2124E|nr:hypothetical protein [Leucobacter japonicus]